MARCVEGIRRALVLGIVLITGTTIEQAPSIGPPVYLFMAYIVNPDLFVCSCRTWIWLDITRFYEEQRQASSGSAWPACPKIVNRAPIAGGGGFDTICTTVCNRRYSATDCRLCRLDFIFITFFLHFFL